MLHLKIITPRKIVLEEEVDSITAPSANGEITILPHHSNLFSLLVEGIIKIRKDKSEDFLAIGAGYLQTDGEKITVLVSRAYGQDEIDNELTEKALNDAKKILEKPIDKKQRDEASQILRRSIIDMKLLKKRKAPKSFHES